MRGRVVCARACCTGRGTSRTGSARIIIIIHALRPHGSEVVTLRALLQLLLLLQHVEAFGERVGLGAFERRLIPSLRLEVAQRRPAEGLRHAGHVCHAAGALSGHIQVWSHVGRQAGAGQVQPSGLPGITVPAGIAWWAPNVVLTL